MRVSVVARAREAGLQDAEVDFAVAAAYVYAEAGIAEMVELMDPDHRVEVVRSGIVAVHC